MSDLNYINYDPEEIRDTILDAMEDACGVPLQPGDERRIFGESALTSIFVALFASTWTRSERHGAALANKRSQPRRRCVSLSRTQSAAPSTSRPAPGALLMVRRFLRPTRM